MGVPLGGRALDEVVAHTDHEVRLVERVDDVVVLRDAHHAEAPRRVGVDDALAHHGLDHGDVQALGHGAHRLAGLAAHRAGTGQDDRALGLGDEPGRLDDARGVGVELGRLLLAQGARRAGHVGHVLGQVDVGGAGFGGLGVLEGEAADLGHRVRAHDHLAAFGDGREHGREVEVLVARELHLLTRDLARDGHERRAVEEGVGHAGHEVGGARPQGRETHAGVAREATEDVGHEGGALLVARGDEANVGVLEREHEVEVLLARNAEDDPDPLCLETLYQYLGRARLVWCGILELRHASSFGLVPGLFGAQYRPPVRQGARGHEPMEPARNPIDSFVCGAERRNARTSSRHRTALPAVDG